MMIITSGIRVTPKRGTTTRQPPLQAANDDVPAGHQAPAPQGTGKLVDKTV
jgi:hypothetical protein